MRSLPASVMLVALLGSAGALADGTMSLNQFPHRLEPVLMRVDAHGKVTQVSPAYRLPLKLDRLLRANLDEMISKPAVDKQGKAIPSQFIMNVALRTEPRSSGDYDAWFDYVSTAPVPSGSWYWVHLDGDRLALANQDIPPARFREPLPVHRLNDGYRPTYRENSPPTPTPTIQNTPPSPANLSAPPVRAQ